MADEKIEKEELEELEQEKEQHTFESESYISKFINAGLLMLGSKLLFKNKKNSEALKAGTVIAGSYLLSKDEDYSKDTLVLATMFGASSGLKYASELAKTDINTYAKFSQYAKKADSYVNNFNLSFLNLGEKTTETFLKEFELKKSKFKNQKDISVTGQISSAISATFSTMSNGIGYLFNNGFYKSLDSLKETSSYKQYKAMYSDIPLIKINSIISELEDSLNFKSKKNDVGFFTNKLENFNAKFFKASQSPYMADIKKLDTLKKMRKFQTIENNSFFSDVLGNYTNYENGVIDVDLARIINDGSNFARPLNRLAYNFIQSLDVLKTSKNLSSEDKESLFIDYLKDNGFESVVNEYYKNDKYLTFGEVGEKLKDFKNDDRLSKFMYSATKSKTSFMKIEDDTVIGLEYEDLLKNFAFTNIVSKIDSKNFRDETTLNGSITALKALGTFEKNAIGAFKLPLYEKQFNLWNPFNLINSNARIKNILMNDYIGFAYNKQGFFLDGSRIAEAKVIDFLKKNDELVKQVDVTKYIHTDDNVKMIYNKGLLDIINDAYAPKKEFQKIDGSYRNLWNSYKKYRKENGIIGSTKLIFSDVSRTHINPFGFRYDTSTIDGKIKGHFRFVSDYKDGYFKDEPFINNVSNRTKPYVNKVRRIWNKDVPEVNNYDFMMPELIAENEIMEETAKEIFSYIEGIYSANFFNYYRKIPEKLNRRDYELMSHKLNKSFNFDSLDFKTFFNPKTAREEVRNYLEEIESIIKNKSSESDVSNFLIKLFNDTSLKDAEKYNLQRKMLVDLLGVNGSENKQLYSDDLFFNFFEKQYSKAISTLFPDSRSSLHKYRHKLLALDPDFKDENTLKEILLLEEFATSVLGASSKTRKNIYNKLHENYSLKNNFIDEFFVKEDIVNYDNISNNIYEITKGYEINKSYKKLNENWKKFDLGDNPFEALAENEILSNNKNLHLSKQVTNIGSKIAGFSKKNVNQYYINPQSYKPFNKIDEVLEDGVKKKIYNPNAIRKGNLLENIERYNKMLYVDREEPLSSSMIKRINIENISLKNILTNIKNFIYKIMENSYKTTDSYSIKYTRVHNKKDFIQAKMKEAGRSKEDIEKIKDIMVKKERTVNFDINRLDSHTNLLSKTAINQLQNALEFIGIEHIPEKNLGVTAFQQIKNFTKYRYLPLLSVATGAIAIDSASDAFIPDETPIIGNGISGVAAKGIAAGRVGIQVGLNATGILPLLREIETALPGSIDNTLGNSLDLLMSPSEMIDVYFNGKPIEIKNNRWWFTAGRQSGEGEEFRQYRPHLLYIAQNKDAGIYSNKIEKLFRQDFLFTKYPWYILDPYKEEREAFEKYGALYPKTEQLFAELPVFGGLINATIGEVIKPTQYIGEDQWRVSENLIKNPHYDPNDPSSPEFIKFDEPNKLIKSFFDAAEDLKTFAGIAGYGVTKATENLFGTTNPYENEVNLSSIDQDIGAYSKYDRLQLGDLFGMTEPVRRLVDDPNALGMININPLEQNLPEWMPDYFRKGNNPYMSWDFGSYILPGETFDKAQDIDNDELKRFRILSMIAPGSADFENSKQILNNNLDNFSREEQQYFYESLGYANEYGERDYIDRFDRAKNITNINLTIDKKISPYEFISDGKRYKLDTVEDDYNKLSKIYGDKKAYMLMETLNKTFNVGDTYSFLISQDATYSVGSDKDGDYFRIDSELVDNKLNLNRSGYRGRKTNIMSLFKRPFEILKYNPRDISYEKIIGNKDIYSEWSSETVQTPFFRDWDSPVSSFIEPFYTYSSNSMFSSRAFKNYSDEIYMNSNSSFNTLGLVRQLGSIQLSFNYLFDNTTTSSQYKEETKVHDEIEKIKFLAGDKSFYNMTGKETIKQFSKMVNEQDAAFLEDLVNVKNNKEREKILQSANHRLSTVLKTIWNRHQETLNNTLKYNDVEIGEFEDVIDIGAYYGNSEDAKNQIKKSLGISLSKLDAKRQGIFNAYRGIQAEREADFISNRLYRRYNVRPYVSSTIYGQGTININKKGENNY